MIIVLNLGIVFLFGAFFGFVELLQRYRELKYIFNKKNNVLTSTLLYIILNGIVSLLSFFVIKYFKGQSVLEIESFEINNVLIAGFGGMMILRSSVFSIKHNNKQIDIGLAVIFQTFLDVVERKMKNNAAALRVCDIYEIMKNVDFSLAKDELPSLCIEFIDNFTAEDSTNLKNKIVEIDGFNIDNVNKSMQLGREIAYYCDEEILKRAIKKLPHIHIKEDKSKEIKDEFESRKLKLK